MPKPKWKVRHGVVKTQLNREIQGFTQAPTSDGRVLENGSAVYILPTEITRAKLLRPAPA